VLTLPVLLEAISCVAAQAAKSTQPLLLLLVVVCGPPHGP
jgi:hypothetical protein